MSIYDFLYTDQYYILKVKRSTYLPLFPDKTQEVMALSNLRGKSGVLGPHLSPSRVLRRWMMIPNLNIRSVTLPTGKNHTLLWAVCKGKGCNTRYTTLSHELQTSSPQEQVWNSSPEAFLLWWRWVYIRRQKGPGLVLALCSIYLQDVTQVAFSPVFHWSDWEHQ